MTSSCAHVSRIIRDKRLNNPTRSADEWVIEAETVLSYSLKFLYLIGIGACNNSKINNDTKRCIKIEWKYMEESNARPRGWTSLLKRPVHFSPLTGTRKTQWNWILGKASVSPCLLIHSSVQWSMTGLVQSSYAIRCVTRPAYEQKQQLFDDSLS